MALIVEDGTIVANANSYIDLSFLISYASLRGLSIQASSPLQEQAALRAMDYLESIRFQGSKVNAALQTLQWPRKDVLIDCVDFAENQIPLALKNAQAQLIVSLQAGIPLWPMPITSISEGMVIEKTVGPLTKKWSANKSNGEVANPRTRIIIAQVEVFLNKLTQHLRRLTTTTRKIRSSLKTRLSFDLTSFFRMRRSRNR